MSERIFRRRRGGLPLLSLGSSSLLATAPTSTIGGKTVAGGKLDSSYCGYVAADETTGTEASHESKLDAIRSWWMSDMYMYADSNTSIDSGAVWAKTDDDVAGWTQGTGEIGDTGMYDITLNDMVGVDLGDEKWTTFMNQLTWDELCAICNNGYHLTVAVPTIGKLQGKDENGPNYTYNGTTKTAASYGSRRGLISMIRCAWV